MLNFKEVTFRNFFSFGHRDITIQLDKSKSTLLAGDSGSGKSTIISESITFALFGKPFRKIKKNDIINQVNVKDCLVTLRFDIGDDEYKIVRGLKPDIFEIYKDGIMVNQNPSVRDYQKYLEEHILHMSYKVWCTIVVLGFANHTPFMSMSPHERRQVVDEVLGIEVFQRMYLSASKRASETKQEIQSIITNIENLKNTIELQKKSFRSIQQQEKEKEEVIIQDMAEINSRITAIMAENDVLTVKCDELFPLVNTKQSLSSKFDELQKTLTKLKYKRSQIEETNKFISKNVSCPSCLQSIDDEYREQFSITNEAKLNELVSGIEILGKKSEEYMSKLSECDIIIRQISDIETKKLLNINSISQYQNELIRKQNELGRISIGDSSAAKDIAKTIIELTEKQKQETELKSELGDLYRHITLCQGLLKEDGIKGKIVAMYLPLLTKLVNDYLESMNFFMRISFDDNFNETIYARFRDKLTFQQLSQGEQSRVNLAIILAWRSLAEMRNSVKSSVLILDELLDTAISAADTEVLMDLISSINKDQNIFIISHKRELVSNYVDEVINVEKVGNFSVIS